jgi:hypothetical protein
MTRMKISIAAVGVLALLVTAAGVSVASRVRVASAADVPVVQAVTASATTPGPASNPAVHLTPSTEAVAVDSSTAMAGVRTRIQPAFLASASSVTIGEYRFTDDELATSVAPANALVWVVSLNDVDIPFMGAPGMNRKLAAHQLDLVIDAKTGDRLVDYTSDVTMQ